MLRKAIKLLYRLGLRQRYTEIDRIRYLKRLAGGKSFADTDYFNDQDKQQFQKNNHVYVLEEFRGTNVLFKCNINNHFERKIVRHGFSNHAALEYMADYAQPSTVVLDVGANVGVYAVPLATAFSELEVHAFEPNAAVARAMRENAELNRLKNLLVHCCALTDTVGAGEFYQFDDDISLSSLNYHAAKIHGEPKRCVVEQDTIDHLFGHTSSKKVSFVKIDVQGAELQVLRGASQVIRRDQPVILFEHEDLHFETQDLARSTKSAIAALLGAAGYQTFYITRFDHRLLFPVDWSKPVNGDLIALPTRAAVVRSI